MAEETGALVPLGEVVSDLIAVPEHHGRAQLAHELAHWSQQARGAYAANTQRAWRADWRVFAQHYCARTQQCAMPAAPEAVRAFVLECVERAKRPATIRRYLASITRAHRAARCPDPCADESVRLAMRAAARTLGARQKQARGLVWAEIERYLAITPEQLRDHRDRALIAVAYDTMCRSEELVALDVEHVTFEADGSATVSIDRSKTDQEGEGATAYLAPTTARLLQAWLERAGIESGTLFRQIRGLGAVGERLRPGAVATVFKRLALWIGLPADHRAQLSGHSARVGATQDLLAHNADVAAVMLRYGHRMLARRNAMATLAQQQGRSTA